jgi:hypothetical protein
MSHMSLKMNPAHKVIDYYGGKYRLARYYPAPLHDVIIEPFCGGAGYSLHHYNKQVHLYDLNPKVVGVWDYVIKADTDEIRALPLLEPEQRVSDLQVHQEAKWLIGWWIAYASPSARITISQSMKAHMDLDSACAWTPPPPRVHSADERVDKALEGDLRELPRHTQHPLNMVY